MTVATVLVLVTLSKWTDDEAPVNNSITNRWTSVDDVLDRNSTNSLSCTHTQQHTHSFNCTVYKYWLVPRSTLKNSAPKLCNVARGPKVTLHNWEAEFFSVDRGLQSIFVLLHHRKHTNKFKPAFCRTGLLKPVIHTLSALRETWSNFI